MESTRASLVMEFVTATSSPKTVPSVVMMAEIVVHQRARVSFVASSSVRSRYDASTLQLEHQMVLSHIGEFFSIPWTWLRTLDAK